MMVRIWIFKYDGWAPVYGGKRDDIPKKYEELVAMLDASDSKRVKGVGVKMNSVDYYLGGGGWVDWV